MVVSTNPEPNQHLFEKLIESTLEQLHIQAKSNPLRLQKLQGNKLEPHVGQVMNDLAHGTPFENSIEVVGGQKFPDIVVHKFYGIEVKTTTKNHWKTTGNSVLESTRIEDVERIYMLFGKLATPIGFKCRPYDECLSEVVVTHSPRYLVDMNLQPGSTIFDKINSSYDQLRTSNNPIKPMTDYYRKKLKPGQELWWIDNEGEASSNIIIDIWNNLSLLKRNEIRARSFVYFPEVLGRQSDKFSSLSVWLVTRKAIVCPNIRDVFTAGGKRNISIGKHNFDKVPRVFEHLFSNIDQIKEILEDSSSEKLTHFWKSDTTEQNKINDWINLVLAQSSQHSLPSKFNMKDLLTEIFA